MPRWNSRKVFTVLYGIGAVCAHVLLALLIFQDCARPLDDITKGPKLSLKEISLSGAVGAGISQLGMAFNQLLMA